MVTLTEFVERQSEHTQSSEEVLAEFHEAARETVLAACQSDLARLEERLQVCPWVWVCSCAWRCLVAGMMAESEQLVPTAIHPSIHP